MTALLGENHPFIVHFAVALTLASVLFDLLALLFRRKQLESTAFSLLFLSLPFLILAVLSGNLAFQSLHRPDAAHLLDQHQTYANIGMWLFCIAAVWRVFLSAKRQFGGGRRFIYLVIAAAAAVSIFSAAQKGGKVFHAPPNPGVRASQSPIIR